MTGATLDDLTPRPTRFQQAARTMTMVVVCGLLVATYISTGINPVKLYQKRDNAVSYLFGRDLTESDRESAMEQARRMPEIIVQEEAQSDVKEAARNSGTSLSFVAEMEQTEALVEKRLSDMSDQERKAIIQDEYARIIDEKRGGFFPPETRPALVSDYISALAETLAIAIWGTLFAILAAIPVSLFAAENTIGLFIHGDSRFLTSVRKSIQFTTRRILDFCRGFNEFVMALIFVAVIGLGPFAGIVALAIHSFGILGKVFSEAIEAIDPGPVEGVTATGAGSLHVVSFAVIPQVMPTVVSYSLLRFETNVRSATILGFVGAGGIGFLMFDKINGYLYREVCTMMILVILAVIIIDGICGRIRKRFI